MGCNEKKLRTAAFVGDVPQLLDAIEKGALINDKELNDPQDAALHRACRAGHLDVVKILVEHGANIDQLGGRNSIATPFLLACQEGHEHLVRYLVQLGANPNSRDPVTGSNALHSASQNGHLGVVIYLIEELGFNINALEHEGISPLFRACLMGKLNVVKYLTSKPTTNLHTLTNKGLSLLHCACSQGVTEIVKHLLQTSVKSLVNEVDDKKRSPLIIACIQGNPEITSLLLEAGAKCSHDALQRSPLTIAINTNNIAIVKLLLNSSPLISNDFINDINYRDVFGRSAISLALSLGYCEIVQYIVRFGADIRLALDIHPNCYPLFSVLNHYRSLSPNQELLSWNGMLRIPVSVTSLGLLETQKFSGKIYSQMIAFLMGTHARLGKDSPIIILPFDIIQSIVFLLFPKD
eukprot:c7451_g1_i1.p1 GENE.c7451_g1_i1~~c7451_g1_i1.p1  ORF type:complete len:408 (+),score=104.55 c7451_g1_i1:29-1252(+)